MGNLLQPIRITTQISVLTHHQYRISMLISQMSFCRETSGGIMKCQLFSQAMIALDCEQFQGLAAAASSQKSKHRKTDSLPSKEKLGSTTVTGKLACKNSHFSSLFTAGDASCAGMPVTQGQKSHTDDINQCLHNISGSHGVSHSNFSILCLHKCCVHLQTSSS